MRGLPWLLGAGALIGGGGLLMTLGDSGAAAHKRERLAFPTQQRAAEQTRAAARRTLAPKVAAQTDDGQAVQVTAPNAMPRDPLLVALAPDADVALVLEADAILHAPVGQAIIGCLGAEERAHMNKPIAAAGVAKGTRWIDLADRVGFSKSKDGHGLFVLDGKLDAVDWSKVVASESDRAGVEATTHEHGGSTIYDIAPSEEGRPAMHAAVWRQSLLLASNEASSVEAAIDRLDSGGAAKLAIDESEAYGEIYGVVGAEALSHVMPENLKDRARDVTKRALVHVDATDEVLLVADVEGDDAKQVEDLGKSIGAAMAVGRLQAKQEGNDKLVTLLDQSRVRPYGGGRLRAEVAIPTEIVTSEMRGCKR